MKTVQKTKKGVSPEEWSRRLSLFTRVDIPNSSAVTCNCGTTFSWQGIDDALHPWIEEHMGHMGQKPFGRRNLIDDTMATAKLMAGSCWPSADATRWALERLARTLTDRAATLSPSALLAPATIRELLLEICGLPEKKGGA